MAIFMREEQIAARTWIFILVVVVAALLSRWVLSFSELNPVIAWAFVFVIFVVLMVLAFMFKGFLESEKRKERGGKKKVESAVMGVWFKVSMILCLVFGILLILFGLLFFAILILANMKGDISEMGSLMVGGSGTLMLLFGLAILFFGVFLGRKKS